MAEKPTKSCNFVEKEANVHKEPLLQEINLLSSCLVPMEIQTAFFFFDDGF